jgi:eukaryotic-like serine/threonine-protein kinase
VVEEVVYVGSNDAHLYAIDSQTGQPRWKFKTGFGVESSPVIYDGSVFVGSNDNVLYALDGQTGQARWRFETQGNISSSPTISRGVLYFGSDDFHLYAIRLNDHCGNCLRV